MAHVGSLSFSRTLRETLTAYAFDAGGIIAGFLIVAYQLQTGIFEKVSWVLALYPAVLGAKVVIEGLLSDRLSTGLHLGTIYPRLTNNTRTFYTVVQSIVVLTLVTSVAVSAASLVFGELFWGVTFADLPSILAVVLATMTVGLVLLLVTVKVGFLSYKRGLDPDVAVYPAMSLIASIFISFCYVAVLNLFFFSGTAGAAATALIGAANIGLVLYIILKRWHESEFVKIIRESLAALMIVALFVNVSGAFLKGVSRFVSSRVVFFAIYPALVALVSDVGSVVGSTATTKLALGELKPTFSSLVRHAKSIVVAWFSSIFMFIVVAFVAVLIQEEIAATAFYSVLAVLAVANFVAVALVVLMSFAIAILTFQRGLDPGNFVIPIEKAFSASIATFALLLSLALFTLVSVI